MTVSFLSSPVPAQTGYEWKSVAIGGGGFVDGFVYHPKVKGLMYARTDMGGAYRWNPVSNSWIPITDWIGSAADDYGILAIALDPNDGSKVYLLTGKYSNTWAGGLGNVLCSSDTGKTFTKTPLKIKNGGNMDGRGSGERLVVDPNQGSVLFLAGSGWDLTNNARIKGSLWKSTDGGKSFDSLSSGPKGDGMFVLFDPSSGTKGNATQVIYAGYDSSNAGAAALWRSKDGGATWSMVPGQPTGLIPSSGCINGHYAYFSLNNGLCPGSASKGQLMRLNTADDSWTDVSPVKNATFGFGTPSIDLQKPSRLVVSSFNRWYPGDDVWLSENNGDSWDSKLLAGILDLSFAPWKSARSPHWIASVQMDPFDSNVALFGTGYGVFRTSNLLTAKPVWAAADSNLEETVPLQLVVPTSGAKLFSAMGDQGGFRHVQLDKAAQEVLMPSLGTISAIDIAWKNQAILVKAHPSANSAGSLGEVSTDSGKTWTLFASNPTGAVIPTQENGWAGGGGTRTIAVNANGSSIVWTAPSTSGAYYSKDNGATWTKSTSDIAIATSGATPFGDKVNPNKMYVMDIKSGIMFVSTDAGVSFKAGGSFNKLDEWESDNCEGVTVPGYEGILLVASDHSWGGGGLYVSTNYGSTFTKISNVGSATKVAVGKAASGKSFPAVYILGKVNSIYGIYRSDDSLASWKRVNDDQHQFGTIHYLAGDMNTYGRVFLATEGRGIIYGEYTGTSSARFSSRQIRVTQSRISYSGNKIVASGVDPLELLDLSGRVVRVGLNAGGVMEIKLSGLTHGVYFARCGSEVLQVGISR